jgi:hypothetical protein
MERNVRYLSSVMVVTSRLRLLQPENNQQIGCMLPFFWDFVQQKYEKSAHFLCVYCNSAKLEVLHKRQSKVI